MLYREHAYAPRGMLVNGKISGNKYKRTNIVAAKCCNNIVAPLIYDGTTDSAFFEWRFEHHFLKAIPKHSVAVLDNAMFHRKKRLFGLAAIANCDIIFLPPYSPDLNPIEKFWACLKRKLRNVLPTYLYFIDALVDCF